MSVPIGGLLFAGFAWLGVLFAVALLGDSTGTRWRKAWPVIYSLSLAVYCTAWTFYGTTTQAALNGWPIPPTFIGTILLFLFGWPFLVRLVDLSKASNSTSIADFIATRFGKSSALAATVTAIAALGIVPYISLQLKAIAMSFSVLGFGTTPMSEPPAWQDVALYVALLMGLFVVLFGTRKAAATEHNQGLVLAMGFESLLKLSAMLALGLFVVFGLFSGPVDLVERTDPTPFRNADTFLTLVLLGGLAMFTLPHQFHIGMVECRDSSHVRTARWLFPLFLVLIALPIVPLARAGATLLGDGVAPDLYVLMLPLGAEQGGLALFAFLGGLSAATGMVILASLTLAIMMGNHWVTPLLADRARRGIGIPVLTVRRVGILIVMGLAYLYSREIVYNEALGDIGALSFSGLAQLAPAVLLAVYRPGLPASAILGGLFVGTATWAWVLLLPMISPDWGAPTGLLGLGGLDALSRAVILSLAANLLTILLLSQLRFPDRVSRAAATGLDATGLQSVARHFLTPERVRELFSGKRRGTALEAAVEHELAAVVGSASARLLLDAARKRTPAPLDTVVDLVGQASAQARFSYEVLSGALQHMSHGVCVVDSDLRLVAWNRRYLELFDYPPELIRVGCPISDLLLHNARRGLMGRGNPAELVERRLLRMRSGSPQRTERDWPDGTIIEIRGDPMPGGGFVATFADVTAFRRAAADKDAAERANEAKSRFLAAVGHDLVQPLNAAHLLTWSLAQRLGDSHEAEAVNQIAGAIGATEALLASLLDISRLEAGRFEPRRTRFALNESFAQLAGEFSALAAERGLSFSWVPTSVWVETDAHMLRRILQNFLSNAVRYTDRGRILLGARRQGNEVLIGVWDTGPGIAPDAQAVIFEEFRRLRTDERAPGLGLGLAIADRMATLLGHRLGLVSVPGRGTLFWVKVPRAEPGSPQREIVAGAWSGLPGARVLTVDNDPTMLESVKVLLTGWGCRVLMARSPSEAEAVCAGETPDIVLLDYHLDGGLTGLDVLAHLRTLFPVEAAVIISADHGAELRAAARAAGCAVLHKPIRPLALKSLLRRLLAARPR